MFPKGNLILGSIKSLKTDSTVLRDGFLLWNSLPSASIVDQGKA